MDEAIHFDLPGREQRGKLLALYLDKYISKAGTEQVSRSSTSRQTWAKADARMYSTRTICPALKRSACSAVTSAF
jgi:hypothetical protein